MPHWYSEFGDALGEGEGFPSPTTILGVRKIQAIQDWRDRIGPEAADKHQQERASLGTRVHLWITTSIAKIQFPVAPEDIEPYCAGFMSWARSVELDLWKCKSEQFVISKQYGYAGTADLICQINGEQYIVDFKTSKKIDPGMGLQLRAYEQAYYEMCGRHSKMAIVQLTPEIKRGYRFREFDSSLDVFLAHKTIFDWLQESKPKIKKYTAEDLQSITT